MASASSSCPSKSTFLSTGLQGLNLGDLRLPAEAAVMPPPPPPPTSAVTTTTTRTGAIPKVSHPPIVLGRLEKCASASSVVGTTTADSAPISSSAAASSSPASTSKKRRNRRQRRRRTVDDNGGKPPPALVLAAAAKGGDGVEDEEEDEELPVEHDSNSEMPRPAGVLADLTMLEKVERRVPGFNPGEGADEVARRFLEALREDDMGLDGGGKQPEQTKEEQDEEPPKHNIPPESFSSATPVSARKTAGGGSRRRRRKRKKQRSPDKEEEVDKENKFSAAAAAEPKSEDDEDDEEGEDGESSGEPRKFVWRNVVKSGAVKKCVLVEGRMEGGRPAAGDTVLVRSQGKLRDGTIVDDHSTLVFNVGEHEVVEGLDLAVRSMHKNELSIVSVKPEAAYGELGRKGDVPAGARITYLFGLMHFEKQKEICQLTWAQRRKCGQSRMRLANWWYQRKEYPVAVKCYKRALEYYNNIPTNQECSTAEEYKELLQLMEERLRIMRQVASIFKRIANLIQSGQISS